MSRDRQIHPARVVALCGGVGGAKLAFGLAKHLGPDLTVVVNTGDDFEHLGLAICPDIDTVIYTLSGLANRELGWGRADESWNFMETLGVLGGETWFRLGDRDLALHIYRTNALSAGPSLTRCTEDIAKALGVESRVLPMCDGRVQTIVETSEGALAFQRYFVDRRCEPEIKAISFGGASSAQPSPQVVAALRSPLLEAVVICPSNPYLSIDPILAVPGMRQLIHAASAPVVAVSPIIAGKAVKGPTRKIMDELGVAATSAAIASHYGDLLDGLVIDRGDATEAQSLDLPVRAVPTLMATDTDRIRLASDVLDFAVALANDRLRSKGTT